MVSLDLHQSESVQNAHTWVGGIAIKCRYRVVVVVHGHMQPVQVRWHPIGFPWEKLYNQCGHLSRMARGRNCYFWMGTDHSSVFILVFRRTPWTVLSICFSCSLPTLPNHIQWNSIFVLDKHKLFSVHNSPLYHSSFWCDEWPDVHGFMHLLHSGPCRATRPNVL